MTEVLPTSTKEVSVLDHDFFSSQAILKRNGHLAFWHAVRAKHLGYQMLSVGNYTFLIDFIASKQKTQGGQIIGSDLISQQHTQVIFKNKGQEINMNKHGISNTIVGIKGVCDVLQNGVLQFEYEGTSFFIYVTHHSSSEKYAASPLCILTWRGDDTLAGKQLLLKAYNWSQRTDFNREQVLVFDGSDCYGPSWKRASTAYKDDQALKEGDLLIPNGIADRFQYDFESFFNGKKVYEELQISWKRGLLMIGPPSSGKNNLLQMVLLKAKYPVLIVELSTLCRVRSDTFTTIFKKAHDTVTCVLVLKDIDKVVEEKNRMLLINQLDKLEPNGGVLVIATASDTSKLDDTILKNPSRFDTHYLIDLPNADQRSQFLTKLFEERIKKDRLVYDSEGISGFDGLLCAIVDSTNGWTLGVIKRTFVSFLYRMAATALTTENQTITAPVSALLDHLKVVKEENVFMAKHLESIEEAKKVVKGG